MRRSLRADISALTLSALATLWLPGMAHASAEQANLVSPPAKLAVKGSLTPPPAGVADLKFGEMFKMPVGPKGLEASDKLTALTGQRARMVGYVANAEAPTPGMLVLTPLPVTLGDEDEKLVDDLPPTAVFVHLSPAYAKQSTPNFSGLIQLTGRLETGAKEEADGHVSSTRLVLDDATSRLLVQPARGQTARHAKH
ncbi:MAG: hypothetical protein ACM3VZ_13410 [Acidobacteriota bacterium]